MNKEIRYKFGMGIRSIVGNNNKGFYGLNKGWTC